MIVALVVEWLDTDRGGAETSVRQFIDELLAIGLTLHVITRSRIPNQTNLHIHRLEPWALTRKAATAAFLDAAEIAVARATAEPADSAGARPSAAAPAQASPTAPPPCDLSPCDLPPCDLPPCDLIHAFIPCRGAHLYQPRGGLIQETIDRTIASRPTAWSRRLKRLDLALNRRQKLLLRREREWLTSGSKPLVVAISHYVQRQLHHHLQYPASHIRHIPNGVRTDPPATIAPSEPPATTPPFPPSGEPTATPGGASTSKTAKTRSLVLLQICHNFRLKGLETTIRAIARCNHNHQMPITLIVAGRDKPGPWKRLTARLGVGDQVRFTGPVQHPMELFCQADLLVHPTFYDPCSRVVLEALAHGLPVITSRFDGAAEAVESGHAGFVLNSPADDAELAALLLKLSDPDLRRQLAARARAMRQRVSMARHAREVVAVYEELISGRAGRLRSC